MNKKLKHIRNARQKVMNAAKKILREEMNKYVDKFGWDQDIDSHLWYGVNDCGIGFLIAMNSSIKNAEQADLASDEDIMEQIEESKKDGAKIRDFEELAEELGI